MSSARALRRALTKSCSWGAGSVSLVEASEAFSAEEPPKIDGGELGLGYECRSATLIEDYS